MSALETKQKLVDEVAEEIKASTAVYILNFAGLTVAKDNALRKSLSSKNIRYRAVKNTLLKRALNDAGITGMDEILVGSSAIMLGDEEEPMAPAKEIVAFHKENPDFLAVKSISMDGELIPGDKVEDVSKMPGRTEMIGNIVSIALGPGAELVAILKGPGATLAGQIKALEEKLEA